MNLDTIREAVLARLADDSAFKTLAGATAADPRLYARNEPPPTLTPAKPVYVTYGLMPTGEGRSGVMEPTYSMVVWAHPARYDLISAIRGRIDALFNKKTWTIGSLRVRSRIVIESDLDETTGNFLGRMLHVRVGALDLG